MVSPPGYPRSNLTVLPLRAVRFNHTRKDVGDRLFTPNWDRVKK